MPDNDKNEAFFPVNVSALRVGMLAERTLYLYLKANNKYVKFVHAFHPLEEKKLEKIRKHGEVFADKASYHETFPMLQSTTAKIRALCDDHKKFPFEKNLEINQTTAWIFHALFSGTADEAYRFLPIVLVQLSFSKPTEAQLLSVSEVSIEIYEKALLHASLSALIALWLGYTDQVFISGFVETVFTESIKTETGTYERNDGDELSQILMFSKECVQNGFKPLATLRLYRIARKLLKIFPENFESKKEPENVPGVAA